MVSWAFMFTSSASCCLIVAFSKLSRRVTSSESSLSLSVVNCSFIFNSSPTLQNKSPLRALSHGFLVQSKHQLALGRHAALGSKKAAYMSTTEVHLTVGSILMCIVCTSCESDHYNQNIFID